MLAVLWWLIPGIEGKRKTRFPEKENWAFSSGRSRIECGGLGARLPALDGWCCGGGEWFNLGGKKFRAQDRIEPSWPQAKRLYLASWGRGFRGLGLCIGGVEVILSGEPEPGFWQKAREMGQGQATRVHSSGEFPCNS